MKASTRRYIVSCLLAVGATIPLHYLWLALGLPVLIRVALNFPICYAIIVLYNKPKTLTQKENDNV
jgi:hypothetical protein